MQSGEKNAIFFINLYIVLGDYKFYLKNENLRGFVAVD